MSKTIPRAAIFLHIPKCGGQTVAKIVSREFRPGETRWLSGQDPATSIEQFASLPESERATYRFLYGHLPFGLHEHVPGPYGYFTMLRDPVERVISGYFNIVRDPHNYMHDKTAKSSKTLMEFLDAGVVTAADNGQTRLLCGDLDALDIATRGEGPDDVRIQIAKIGFGECTREMLDRAKRNLEDEIAVVGLTERFNESMILFRREFGWSLPYGRKENVGANRPASESLGPEVYERIKRMNELDCELYDFAVGLFNRRLDAERGAVRRDLRLVRAANLLVGGSDDPLTRGLRWIGRRVRRR